MHATPKRYNDNKLTMRNDADGVKGRIDLECKGRYEHEVRGR